MQNGNASTFGSAVFCYDSGGNALHTVTVLIPLFAMAIPPLSGNGILCIDLMGSKNLFGPGQSFRCVSEQGSVAILQAHKL